MLVGQGAATAAMSNGAPIMSVLKSTSSTLDPRGVRNVRRAVAELSPHVVHAVDRFAAGYAAAASCFGRQAALLVGPARASECRRGAWRLLDPLIAQRADRLLVAAEKAPSGAAGQAAVPIGIQRLSSDPPFRTTLLQELAIPEDAKLIGVAGPLTPERRLKDAVWAADLLKCVRDDTHLLVLGEGPYRWRLQRYCRQVEITDRVHFLGDREDEPSVLASLDCYWETSSVDEVSIPLLEAMSAEIPVVAADSPAARVLFPEDAGGLLVPPGDRATRARRTNTLLNDVGQRQARGVAGRLLVAQRFPIEKMVDAYRELYLAHSSH
ncbi:MAG: glycosyltransferase [Pirellulaceae bacterium]